MLMWKVHDQKSCGEREDGSGGCLLEAGLLTGLASGAQKAWHTGSPGRLGRADPGRKPEREE